MLIFVDAVRIDRTPFVRRFYYSDSCAAFLSTGDAKLLGELSASNEFDLTLEQRGAWQEEITIMKRVLRALGRDGHIVFEYSLPRLGKRIDVALLMGGVVFALEFKAGADEFLANDKEQVWDYALDLKSFHEGSRDLVIVPILVATEAPTAECSTNAGAFCYYDDQVYNPLFSNAQTLASLLLQLLIKEPGHPAIDAHDWLFSRYSPTPTIIQAASALYRNHSVADITKHEADKAGIDTCTDLILDIIRDSKKNRQKSICFVTGVPGAGKTLVGLNVAIQQEQGDLAVYLSGNGPLVKVLTEALARDKVAKEKASGHKCTKSEAERQVSRFIQIIHRYRDNMLAKLKTPIEGEQIEIDPKKVSRSAHNGGAEVENVAIFDEAQRMWDQPHLRSWLARKKGLANFPLSEGEFLIWSLDQHKDWATIVCLVGGGQEINSGEGGIGLWIEALNQRFPDWQIYISDRLTDKEYAEGNLSAILSQNQNVHIKSNLHLAVSQRSYRAETVSLFVHQLLDLDVKAARATYNDIRERYPIVLTRDLNKAKQWLRDHARGSERYGMLVSSKAFRLRPLAIDIRTQADIVPWFLNPITDIRSSLFLEDVATEFDIQGLELDWTCLVWDGDFRYDPTHHCWQHFNFRSDRWTNINIAEGRAYQLNAYRVLLTRARQGMVICIPKGDSTDATRLPEFYDATYRYFKRLGVETI
ncbi:MAG: DUF2075 domain-containing protein [Bacteroidales bacterium]|nr:DUF2075 domain-containing protein [Bacteroidales bacterium]